MVNNPCKTNPTKQGATTEKTLTVAAKTWFVRISTVLFSIVIATIVPAFIIVSLSLDKAEEIRGQGELDNERNARAELRETLLRVENELRGMAKRLAAWDETTNLFFDPTYYRYWRTNRVETVQLTELKNISVDLFRHDGESLLEDAFATSVISSALDSLRVREEDGDVFFYYFFPIMNTAQAEERIGYLGIKVSAGSALAIHDELFFSNIHELEWSLPDRAYYSTDEAVARAKLSVRGSPRLEALITLVRSTFFEILVYGALLLGLVVVMYITLIAKPLVNLVRGIGELSDENIKEIPVDFQGKIALAELELVRAAINDYRDRFLSATDNLKQKNQELLELTFKDALTGVYNRRAFEEHLNRILQGAKQENTQHAICYLDLDQFKVVNDTCGHLAGDNLLQQIAAHLNKEVRDADMLARLGGDEFGVILEGCELEHAIGIAEKLRDRIKHFRFSWEGKLFDLGVSIGVVPVTAHNASIDELMMAADSACYVAKDLGRNRVHVYQNNDAELVQRRGEMQWVSTINRALDEDRFRLYWQRIKPLNRYSDDVHIEVLLRMETDDRRLVPPMAFLPAAERYNVMPRIDRWVINRSLSELSKANLHLNENQFTVAINLSGQSLGDSSFLSFVIDEIVKSKIPASTICFEITETVAITNFDIATRFISELRARGCKFALDDFGSGVSSFGYLKSLHIDFLKIDGHFVKNMFSDPTNYSIVKAINQIGHVMNIKTIAEFVEDARTYELLREIGVDYAQGYSIDKPRALMSNLESIFEPEHTSVF